MDYAALYDRILNQVDQEAYLSYADQVEPSQRDAVSWVHDALQSPTADAQAIRARVRKLHADGKIDAVILYSTLHVIAASPKVRDLHLAARLVADQEMAAIELGGPHIRANLASVDRHRGVIAFMLQRYDVALDYFSRTFERQRNAGNLANVLSTLLRLGDEDEARHLLDQIRTSFPQMLVEQLNHIIAIDPDLALLRMEAPQ